MQHQYTITTEKHLLNECLQIKDYKPTRYTNALVQSMQNIIIQPRKFVNYSSSVSQRNKTVPKNVL